MYKFICIIIVFLLLTSTLFAQHKRKFKIQNSFQVDVLLFGKPEFSLLYERKINRKISILLSAGLKQFKLSDDFLTAKHENAYILEETDNWIQLGIPGTEYIKTFLDNTAPFEELGKFVPKLSIPLRLNVQRNFSILKKQRLFGFWSVGLLTSLHKGYAIDIKTKEISTKTETISKGGFLFYYEYDVITTHYEQTKTITPTTSATLGLNVALGLRWWLNKRIHLNFTILSGRNLINTNSHFEHYAVQPSYLNTFLGIGYAF